MTTASASLPPDALQFVCTMVRQRSAIELPRPGGDRAPRINGPLTFVEQAVNAVLEVVVLVGIDIRIEKRGHGIPAGDTLLYGPELALLFARRIDVFLTSIANEDERRRWLGGLVRKEQIDANL